MRLFRGFAVASAVLAFALAILGSWVRINDAGLTCPDWPLCHGHLVPTLTGGIVLEWTHRLIALVEAFAVIGALATGLSVRNRVGGVGPALAALVAIFVAQVALGGATVELDNSPLSVTLHWAMGMALLAVLTSLAVLSLAAPPPRQRGIRTRESSAPALGIAAAFAFVTMCIGAYVSSSYAGLACPSVPLCGTSLWGSNGAQFAQMVHRVAAASFALVACVVVAFTYKTASPRVRSASALGFALILVQISLGLCAVSFGLPNELREAHAANAVLTFLAFVIATVLSALEPVAVPVRGREAALGRRVATNA